MLALTVASLSWSACGPRLQPAGGVAARARGVRMLEAYGEPAHPVFAKPKAAHALRASPLRGPSFGPSFGRHPARRSSPCRRLSQIP